MNSHFRTAAQFYLVCLISLSFWHINGSDSAKSETRRHQLRRNSCAPLPFSCEACDMNYFMFEWMLQMCIFMANKQSFRRTKLFQSWKRPCDFLFFIFAFGAVNQIAKELEKNSSKRGRKQHQKESNKKSNVTNSFFFKWIQIPSTGTTALHFHH